MMEESKGAEGLAGREGGRERGYANAPNSSKEHEKKPNRECVCATRCLWNPMPDVNVVWYVVIERGGTERIRRRRWGQAHVGY